MLVKVSMSSLIAVVDTEQRPFTTRAVMRLQQSPRCVGVLMTEVLTSRLHLGRLPRSNCHPLLRR